MILTQPFSMGLRKKILNIKRYEIYFADLNPTRGSEIKKVRPVVIISQDAMNKYLDTVVVCPLTSKLHPQWRSRLQTKCANKNAEIGGQQKHQEGTHHQRHLTELIHGGDDPRDRSGKGDGSS